MSNDDLSTAGCSLILGLAVLGGICFELWLSYRAVVALESVAFNLRRVVVMLEEREGRK